MPSNMRKYASAELGQEGSIAITGTSAVTANANSYFFAINWTTSAVVTHQSNFTGANNPGLALITAGFTAGSWVYGQFTSITLSEGAGIGYLAEEDE